MFADGSYVRGETDRALAEEWGLALDTVRDITAEAGRHAEIRWGDGEAAERYARVMLRRIADMASGENPAAAVNAIRTLLQSFGRLRDKVDVSVTTAPTREVVAEAIRQSLADPEMRALVRAELARYPEPLLVEATGAE